MNSIGAIAVAGAAGLGDLSAHLPWAWFALMAAMDVGLVMVVMSRRRRATEPHRQRPAGRRLQPDTLVLRNGWRVPRSRALGLPSHPAAYAWPLHSEYMVSRLG